MSENFYVLQRMIEKTKLGLNEISYILVGDYTGKETDNDRLAALCFYLDLNTDETISIARTYENKRGA